MCRCSSESINPDDPRREWWFLDSFQGYVTNMVKVNAWRVDVMWTEEDIRSELYLRYEHILHQFPTAMEPAHVMQLFKRKAAWFWINASNKATLIHRQNAELELGEAIPDCVGEARQNLLDFDTVLFSLPEEIVEMVTQLISAPTRKLGFRWKKGNVGVEEALPRRETNNQRLCRLLKIKPRDRNLDRELRAVFSFLRG